MAIGRGDWGTMPVGPMIPVGGGDGWIRPQVQDQWGRSPSDPDYGMPPGGWPAMPDQRVPAPSMTTDPPGEAPAYDVMAPGMPAMSSGTGSSGTPGQSPYWGTVGTMPGQMTVSTSPTPASLSALSGGAPQSPASSGSWLSAPRGYSMAALGGGLLRR